MFTERLLRRTLLFEANHDRMVLKWPVDHTTRCDNLNRLACVSQIGQASWIIRDPPKRLVETIGDGPMSQSVEPWHSLTSFIWFFHNFSFSLSFLIGQCCEVPMGSEDVGAWLMVVKYWENCTSANRKQAILVRWEDNILQFRPRPLWQGRGVWPWFASNSTLLVGHNFPHFTYVPTMFFFLLHVPRRYATLFPNLSVRTIFSVIKTCAPESAPILCNLFYFIEERNHLPTPKHGDPSAPKSYLPIPVTFDQFCLFLERGLLSDHQHGFRPRRSADKLPVIVSVLVGCTR